MLSEKVTMSDASDSHFSKLETIRKNSGSPDTIGLSDSEITHFLTRDSKLALAIDQASKYQAQFYQKFAKPLLHRFD